MSRISNEPTYIDGKINPFFQPDPDYVPYVNVIKIDNNPRKCEHYWAWDNSTEPNGKPIKCVYCVNGKILGDDLTIEDGKIVPLIR